MFYAVLVNSNIKTNKMENDKVVNLLNNLLTKNYDAVKGYKDAAEKIELSTLKTYFHEQADNRSSFEHELKALISKYGGQPSEGTSVTADLHRVWIAIRDSFSNGEQAIYAECIRGEETFSAEYGEILMDENVPQDVKEVITTQKRSVDEALGNLKKMKD